eukprot:scaffold103651_cov36-Phaeocystis_antarctica.AAC.1
MVAWRLAGSSATEVRGVPSVRGDLTDTEEHFDSLRPRVRTPCAKRARPALGGGQIILPLWSTESAAHAASSRTLRARRLTRASRSRSIRSQDTLQASAPQNYGDTAHRSQGRNDGTGLQPLSVDLTASTTGVVLRPGRDAHDSVPFLLGHLIRSRLEELSQPPHTA